MAAELLGLPSVGPDTDLYDLGATWDTMIRLAAGLTARYGVRVSVDALIDNPTPRAIADGLAPSHCGELSRDVRIALDPRVQQRFREARIAERRLHPELTRVALDPVTPAERAALSDAAAPREFDKGPLPGALLNSLLTLTASAELSGRACRRYPSAGGCYPVQIYLYVRHRRVLDLAGGLYYLNPGERILVHVDEDLRITADTQRPPNRSLVARAAFGIFLVSTPAAIAPLWGERLATRFSVLEAGHISQLLITSAPARGLGLAQVGSMEFALVRRHFHLEPRQDLLVSLWGGALRTADLVRRESLVGASSDTRSSHKES
ncbi:nitroreductase family protein [Actinokineospora sp.]|uniref:nitroreductase family protein n=1 Tax=Actinokineospora sp. TaxID=1872133 RepID=UPI004037CF82